MSTRDAIEVGTAVVEMGPTWHLLVVHQSCWSSSIFPRIKVFSNESVLPIRWEKY